MVKQFDYETHHKGVRKVKKLFRLLFLFLIVITTGCGLNTEENVHLVDLEGVNTIYIKNSNHNLNLTSVDNTNLKASSGKRNIEIDKKDSELIIKVKKNWFHIGPKINFNRKLQVAVPKKFSGKVFVEGSSGNVSSDALLTNNIEVKSSSGNISLHFAEFHSNVDVNAASGNVEIFLNTDQPHIDLKAKTSSGNLFVAIPLDKTNKYHKKVIEGSSGEGMNNVHVKTASGNIAIK